MKNFTKIFLVMICLGTIHNPLFSQAPTNGLVAYYPFTGNANDASGNGRNGVPSGGIALTTDRYGNANQAYSFNGSNAGITVNSWNTITGNSARTMSVWFKANNPTTNQQILSWGANSANNSNYLGTSIFNGAKYFGFAGYSNDLFIIDPLQYYDNRWHQMTFSFDGNKMTLFLDGAEVANRTGATLSTGSSRLTIGFHYINVDYFNGSLDEIRIYNRALTVSEVQQTYLAEVASSSTTDIIKLGSDKFIHATGSENTFVGLRSGAFANGVGSTFMGRNTGLYNTGSYNSFYGVNAGRLNTTGQFNTFFGKGTGEFNIAGNENTYIGFDAGWQSIGNNNVALGRGAGAWATTGNNNVYIGWLAGLGSQTNPNTGISNTFVGFVSGQFNTLGAYNTFIGSQAGYKNTIGKANTFLGHAAGFENQTGESNTFIGLYAGKDNTVGSANTFLGRAAGQKNISGINNVYVGWASGFENTSGGDNTALGTQAGGLTTIGSYNTNFGKLAGYDNISGSNNTFLGAGANSYGTNKASLFNSSSIGSNARVSINNAIVLGDFENNDLKVGIGIHNPQYRLDVKGVVNMRVGFNSPAMKVNDKVFLALDDNGDFVLPKFKIKYSNENEWSDKVFESNYSLKPIEEVAKFAKENKHLPNMPSAKEVVIGGIEMQAILAKFLEKIEEQTLYIDIISKDNKALLRRIEELERLIKK